MGLKNLKSQFDLVQGPTAPVENMDSMHEETAIHLFKI